MADIDITQLNTLATDFVQKLDAFQKQEPLTASAQASADANAAALAQAQAQAGAIAENLTVQVNALAQYRTAMEAARTALQALVDQTK